jgi:hypothetical protein
LGGFWFIFVPLNFSRAVYAAFVFPPKNFLAILVFFCSKDVDFMKFPWRWRQKIDSVNVGISGAAGRSEHQRQGFYLLRLVNRLQTFGHNGC